MSTEQIHDTSAPDRARAIAETDERPIEYHCDDCGHTWIDDFTEDVVPCPKCGLLAIKERRIAPKAEAGELTVRMTMEQLMTITGILSSRMTLCDERMAAQYAGADVVAYWQREKAEAEAMRELLRAAL